MGRCGGGFAVGCGSAEVLKVQVLEVCIANREAVPQPAHIYTCECTYDRVASVRTCPRDMRKFQGDGAIRLDCNRLWSCPADVSRLWYDSPAGGTRRASARCTFMLGGFEARTIWWRETCSGDVFGPGTAVGSLFLGPKNTVSPILCSIDGVAAILSAW